MIRRALRLVLPFALLAGCAAPGAAPPPAPLVAGTVYIYRGVNTLADARHVDWSNRSFGVSAGGGNIPTLSFVDAYVAGSRDCWLQVPVDAPQVPVPVNGDGEVTLTTNGVANAGASPWTAVFDNNPPGHWSIARNEIYPNAPSNAQAGTVAGRVFEASTQAGQVTLLPGDKNPCEP
jgi:hypothetical protein